MNGSIPGYVFLHDRNSFNSVTGQGLHLTNLSGKDFSGDWVLSYFVIMLLEFGYKSIKLSVLGFDSGLNSDA